MKTALIAFGDFDISKAREMFRDCGIGLSAVLTLSPSDDIGFKRGYETFRDTADALIVADGAEFDLKETVAEFSGVSLIENDNARKSLEERGFSEFSGSLMPTDAIFIPNENGAYQGFALDDRDFTLVMLPNGENEFFPACEKYVLPYLTAKFGIGKSLVFKCFGEKTETEKLLNTAKEKFAFRFFIKDDGGDLKVCVFLRDISDSERRSAVREIAFALKDVCYADSDVSLSETLFTLLKLGGKKISVAESFTGGRVAAAIVKNAGASAYFSEGVVAYTNDSKTKRLFVSEEEISEFGAVSAKVAYRMASGLFKSGNPDIAIATTGLAGPDGDGSGVPVGRCFIAVGTKAGIHTYKFDFSGGREEITRRGVNAALFFAVKTIKNI